MQIANELLMSKRSVKLAALIEAFLVSQGLEVDTAHANGGGGG